MTAWSRFFFTTAAWLAALFTCTSASAERPLTIDYIRAHIAALQGHTVTARGQMDECESLVCEICTEQLTKDADRTCLGVSLASLDAPPRRGEDWPAAAARSARLMEDAYRFATITITAKVDASCELGFDPADRRGPHGRDQIVCTDRATSLRLARVISVDTRRSATQGLWHRYLGEALSLASPEERAEVLREYDRLDPATQNQQVSDRSVLRDGSDLASDMKVEAVDWVCICLEDSCAGRWPTHAGQIIDSPANPYHCVGAIRSNGVWRIAP
jgi:hypothetical protein